MKRIFQIKEGEQFRLSGKVFTVVRFFRKRVPRFGVVPCCETIKEDGKTALFLTDWEVEQLNELAK